MNARTICQSYRSELAHIPNLATYEAFKILLSKIGVGTEKYWISAAKQAKDTTVIWDFLRRKASDLV